MKRLPIDPELLRDRLGPAQGKRYWRSLEELAGDPAVAEMLQREFPQGAAEWTDPVSRRRFLTLMGASLALAGLSGCRGPTGTIMPYVRQPENITPGKALYYATSMPLGGYATGVLVESHEGRPTKIEGNEKHPASLGATTAYGQAAILEMYDPDRAQSVTYRGQPANWSDLIDTLRPLLRNDGKGVAVLTETIGSPTLDAQRAAFLAEYPGVRWCQYEPVNHDNALAGARLAFGKPVHHYYKVDRADVIVSLGADFLGAGPGCLAYTREFSSRRRVQDFKGPGGKEQSGPGGKDGMSRLYAVETDYTITGAKADHRLALSPSQIDRFARALAAGLGVPGAKGPELDESGKRWLAAVVKDVQSRAKGRTLVIAGDGQSAAVHAIAHAINHHLGNAGKTVVYTDPVLPGRTGDSMAQLAGLYKAVEKNEIHTLLIVGGNPAYTAPADLDLAGLLTRQLRRPRKEWLAVHMGIHFDETSRLCHWHVPETHFLESWSDGVAYDGTASIIQPLISPLYAGRSQHELFANLTRRKSDSKEQPGTDYDVRSPYELVRDHWREGKNRPKSAEKAPFDTFWQQALHDGVVAGSAAASIQTKVDAGLFDKAEMKPAAAPEKGYELAVVPDAGVYDGRFANNGWLQEWPRPITRITWDNAVMMSPATAEKLGVRDRVSQWRGGEHGESLAKVVTLKHGGREVQAAAWVLPGHADDALTLSLGYGRTHSGRVGNLEEGRPAGFGNANKLRLSSSPLVLAGVEVVPTGKQHAVACTQAHQSMEGRDIVRSGNLAEYNKDPHFAQERDHAEHAGGEGHEEGGKRKRVELPSLYPEAHKYDGYKWGMAIDMTACTGCGSCVVACQAENNSPVVGKDQVTAGREMHWLRIDRYFETPKEREEHQQPKLDELRVHFQPVLCQHCENAPCEVVCPVEATVHGEEGTNDMVYNRCVGTRYCANNCPYKVRRFNFFQYTDYETPSLRLMYNPDVTVRVRGVMEKCTFCMQRISHARIEASKEALDEEHLPEARRKRRDTNGPDGGPRTVNGKEVALIHDGEVVSACQAACPAGAIVFGDLNDKQSKVRKLHDSTLRYDLLGELGVRPRVAYLAELRNPNPDLSEA
jgi:molybdopterin-containing oxidoreductase family iron-sulfur binding subunit